MTAKSSPLTELAQMADAVAIAVASPPTVSTATIDHCDASKKGDFDVWEEIAALWRDFRQLTTGYSKRSRTPRRGRSPDSGSLPICCIHRKFGDKALRCYQPCFYHQRKAEISKPTSNGDYCRGPTKY